MDFNLQQFLAEMRHEQRSDTKGLADKMEQGFLQLHARISNVDRALDRHVLDDTGKFAGLDKRVEKVESGRRIRAWLVRSAVVAGLGALADLLVHLHFPASFLP